MKSNCKELKYYFDKKNNGEFELISYDDNNIIYKHITCGSMHTKNRKQMNTNGPTCNNHTCCQSRKRRTWLKKYGVDNPLKSKEVREKSKKTCLEKYGVENAIQNKDILKKIQNTNFIKYGGICPTQNKEVREKSKKTCLEKYGVENISQDEDTKLKKQYTTLKNYGVDNPIKSNAIQKKIQKTCLEKYGVLHAAQNQEILKKIQNTKKIRKNYNKSKKEDEIYHFIQENYGETLRQYKTKLYPYNCDFYIVKYDLYIEYNGYWTHGNEIFNPYKKEHIEKVKYFTLKNTSQYKDAINTWCTRDPLKRKTAKDNNLKYIELWYNDDYCTIKRKIEEIIISSIFNNVI